MTVLVSIIALLAGIAAGVLHFTALRVGTDALILGGSLRRAGWLTLGRFALTLAVLAGAALAGTWPLLAAALGFGIGRVITLRRARVQE